MAVLRQLEFAAIGDDVAGILERLVAFAFVTSRSIGCLGVEVLQDIESPHRIVIMEEWSSLGICPTAAEAADTPVGGWLASTSQASAVATLERFAVFGGPLSNREAASPERLPFEGVQIYP